MGAALLLAGCDQPMAVESQPVIEQAPARVAPAPRVVDQEMCDNIEAQRSINARLHKDGYADDYSAEYDKLARAQGCQ